MENRSKFIEFIQNVVLALIFTTITSSSMVMPWGGGAMFVILVLEIIAIVAIYAPKN